MTTKLKTEEIMKVNRKLLLPIDVFILINFRSNGKKITIIVRG